VAGLVGARRDPAEVGAAISGIAGADSRRQAAVLNGLADGMARRGAKLGEFLKSAGAEALLAKAAELAADSARALADRQDSVRLLVHVPWETAAPALEKLLSDEQPQELRVTAVAALSAHPHPDVAKILMRGWKTHLPAMRREVLEAMSRRPERLEFLLAEVEAGRLAPGEVGPSASRTLLNHATLKERAKKVLESGLTEERKAVIERYKPAVAMPGDLRRGRDVFQKNCVACHRIGDLGKPIGPDISDTLSKTKEALLVDVLDPSRVIDNNYANFLVRTKAGAVISGFIAVQTPTSLTLRRGEGQEDVVLRADIDEMRSSGLSLMPDGLEKAVTVEQMADLLAFLKGWRDLENR
jgi:putative heme-binding domain-containing protein